MNIRAEKVPTDVKVDVMHVTVDERGVTIDV